MTRYLVIDTETTGVNPYSARLVELAAILIDKSDGLTIESPFSTLVKQTEPIPEAAIAIHGITTEEANDTGWELKDVLDYYEEIIKGIDFIVAHNYAYDSMVLDSHLRKNGFSISTYPPSFCTMTALTDKCKLPGRYGKYKWPRLDEAWSFCFPEQTLTEAKFPGHPHRALFDASACASIFEHGLAQEWWRLP